MKKKLLFVPDQPHYAEPFLNLFEVTRTNLRDADVVMFTGGADIDPAFYGEPSGKYTQLLAYQRDAREKAVFDYALEHKKPFLGICRGAQFLCAMSGGKLAQHVSGHTGGSHGLMTKTGDEFTMSTLHHQMMLPAGTDHDLIAWTEKLSKVYLDGWNNEIPGIDTEPEIVYFKKTRGLAIQGHPEFLQGDRFPVHARTLRYVNELVKERLF